MKSKPVKGSARTKRFDVGGTVGALAGLGTLAYLMSRKKKGAAGETGKGMGKFPMEAGDGTSGPGMDEYKPKDDAAKQRALQQSKDPKSLLVPEGADKDTLYESDKALARTDGNRRKPASKATRPAAKTATSTTTNASTKATSKPATAKPATAKPATSTATAKPATSTTTTTTTAKPATSTATTAAKPATSTATTTATTTTKPTSSTGKQSDELPSKPYPTAAANAKKEAAAKPSEKKPGGATFITKERSEQAAKAMKEGRKMGLFERGYPMGKKNGGTVKKYADGGTTTSKPAPKKAPMPAFAREAKENRERDQRVKREREEFDKGAPTRLKDQGSFKSGGMTASKRADGIAMRGKTKGKMY